MRAVENTATEANGEHYDEGNNEACRFKEIGTCGTDNSADCLSLFVLILIIPLSKFHAFVEYSTSVHEEILRVLWRAPLRNAISAYTVSSMLTRHERGKVVWVDLESPTRQELARRHARVRH